MECMTADLMQKIIQGYSYNFDLVASHQLLRISYALILTEMRNSFLNLQVKNKEEIKVSKAFFRPRINEDSDIINYNQVFNRIY